MLKLAKTAEIILESVYNSLRILQLVLGSLHRRFLIGHDNESSLDENRRHPRPANNSKIFAFYSDIPKRHVRYN